VPRLAVALCASALAAACATPQSDALRESPAPLPVRAQVIDVPFYAQEDLQCGPASLAMVMTWSGLPARPDELTAQVYTEQRRGSLQLSLLAAARRHGRLAVQISGMHELAAELAAGNPVVVLQNLGLSWYEVWHYAVAIGYDTEAGEVFLHTGPRAARAVPMPLFERTWARSGYWGLVVTAPDRLPALDDPTRLRAAIAGLERSGRAAEAEQATAALAARALR
jgi:ABC-type bacteriocin/lantibiotic exporter with double-glycine peptidase domain